MAVSRHKLFDDLRAQVTAAIAALETTSPELAARHQSSWVWDASAMPAGGHYFPVFLELIAKLEAQGQLDPDRHVLVESTTGSAGLALGVLAGLLGYPIVLFMPEDMPRRRIAAVRESLPANSHLFLTPAGKYVAGIVRELRRFLVTHRAGYEGREVFALDHSRRPESVVALEQVMSPAIAKVPRETPLTATVGALGNGTSSAALFHAARRTAPASQRIGVEPVEAPSAFLRKYGAEALPAQGPPTPHRLIGAGGWGVEFPLLDVREMDAIELVTEEDWRAQQADLRERGIEVGNTTAACHAVIQRLAALKPAGPAAFFSILYDRPSLY